MGPIIPACIRRAAVVDSFRKVTEVLICISLYVQFEAGQSALVAASDSSDRSKDKAGDQKVMCQIEIQLEVCIFLVFNSAY